MNVKQVFYKKLVSSHDDYSNVEFGAWADVGNDTPEDATKNLEFWVNDQLMKMGAKAESVIDLDHEIASKQITLDMLSKEIADNRERAKKIVDFLKRHGVEPTYDIPF